jgi:hypothetical protein
MSLAIRQLVAFPMPFFGITGPPADNMSIEGILWFTDLTQSDPQFILPVIIGGLYLANLEVRLSHLFY